MKQRSRFFSPQLAGTCLLLAATLTVSKLTAERRGEPLVEPLSTISTHISGFTGIDNPPLRDGVLAQLKPTSYLERTYRKTGLEAGLFIAFYSQQRAGESMHSPKHCLPGAGWEIWDYGGVDIPVEAQRFHVNRYSVSHEGERDLVLYWYQSKGRIIASEYLGKILLARDALFQSSTAGSIVRITLPDQPGMLETGIGFATELIPQVQRCFGK